METLLAVDLGLRAGLALFGRDGRLLRHGSSHFPNRTAVRAAAPGVLLGAGELRWLYAEGPADLARPWVRAARWRGAQARLVTAEDWRPDLLLPREQRSGQLAKVHAERLAREVIRWSGLPGPSTLRHDAAEAILMGLWATRLLGWLESPPPFLPP